MRVTRPEDSMAVLDRPDAVRLRRRGHALLRVAEDSDLRQVQVAWGGAPYDGSTPLARTLGRIGATEQSDDLLRVGKARLKLTRQIKSRESC